MGLVDLDHPALEGHVDHFRREHEPDGRSLDPAAALDLDVAREPVGQPLAVGQGLPHHRRRIGQVAFQPHGGSGFGR